MYRDFELIQRFELKSSSGIRYLIPDEELSSKRGINSKSQYIVVFFNNLITKTQFKFIAVSNNGRFCNNSKINKLISKRLSAENKAKLSQQETQNTSSTVLFIYNFQLTEFRFVLYR